MWKVPQDPFLIFLMREQWCYSTWTVLLQYINGNFCLCTVNLLFMRWKKKKKKDGNVKMKTWTLVLAETKRSFIKEWFIFYELCIGAIPCTLEPLNPNILRHLMRSVNLKIRFFKIQIKFEFNKKSNKMIALVR